MNHASSLDSCPPAIYNPGDPPRQLIAHARLSDRLPDEGEGRSRSWPFGAAGQRAGLSLAGSAAHRARGQGDPIDPPIWQCGPPRISEGMSIADRAGTVRAVVAELDLPPVTLVGHSAGGAVVAHIAAHEPGPHCTLL